MTPEQNLWVNVIAQQFHDATREILPPIKKKNGKTQDRPNNNSIHLARTWFETKSEDFQMVCSLAGLDPEYVVRKYHEVRDTGYVKGMWNKRVNYA